MMSKAAPGVLFLLRHVDACSGDLKGAYRWRKPTKGSQHARVICKKLWAFVISNKQFVILLILVKICMICLLVSWRCTLEMDHVSKLRRQFDVLASFIMTKNKPLFRSIHCEDTLYVFKQPGFSMPSLDWLIFAQMWREKIRKVLQVHGN